jgi:hypothetical protein
MQAQAAEFSGYAGKLRCFLERRVLKTVSVWIHMALEICGIVRGVNKLSGEHDGAGQDAFLHGEVGNREAVLANGLKPVHISPFTF